MRNFAVLEDGLSHVDAGRAALPIQSCDLPRKSFHRQGGHSHPVDSEGRAPALTLETTVLVMSHLKPQRLTTFVPTLDLPERYRTQHVDSPVVVPTHLALPNSLRVTLVCYRVLAGD